MVSVGDPVPDVLLIDEAGGEARLPPDGIVFFLSGAFRPGTLAMCADLPDVVVILPDAPPIVRAWSLRVAAGLRMWSDHRPRGAVAGLFGFSPDGDAAGLRVVFAGGCVVEVARLDALAETAAARPLPPLPRPAARPTAPLAAAPTAPAPSWWPGILAAAAWVLVAVALAQTATPGAAPW